jgi:extradiol dioxygenase family protein
MPSPKPFGRFLEVAFEHGVNLDYADAPEGQEIPSQHYAFLVSEQEFDTIYGRIQSRGLLHWADPAANRPGETYENNGGRGVYFPDPSGHAMEIFTQPHD